MPLLMRYRVRMKGKRIALYGLLIALAFVLSFVESLLPVVAFAPGVKLGLTNLVVLIALYRMQPKDAIFINLIRVILVGLTFGNAYSFVYSIAGGVCSFLAMVLLYHSDRFGKVGVSVVGGVVHNLAQVAILFFQTPSLLYYFPVLVFFGTIFGCVIGLLSGEVLKRLPGDLFYSKRNK